MKALFRVLTIAVGAATAAAPLVVHAAPPAKTGAKAAAPKANAKGGASAGKAEERQTPASFGGGPQLDESKRTAAADKKRDEAIAELKEIIPSIETGDQKSELLFQLAELWIEKSKYVYFGEFAVADERYKTWIECVNEEGESHCGVEPKADNHQSELYRTEALRLYEQILKDSPTYPRKDEVLFALATNLYEKGDKNGAIERHRDLVTQYPNSRFVGDSYIAMGEHYFNANDLARAETAYKKALESSVNEPRVYNFALYKLGWCAYNAGEYTDSLKKFQEVVDRSEAQRTKNEVALKGEAMRDMVMTWQSLGQVEEANDYYKRKTSKAGARNYFSMLANRYFSDGNNDLAIRALRLLIDEEPYDPRNPEYQSNIVRSYEGLRQRDRVVAEMKVLVANYKPGSAWSVANKSNQAALANAYDLSESAMRELVTQYHQEAQKTKEVKTYRLAAEIYKEYLDSFAESDSAYNLRFYYAEILWTLEEWEKAAEQYEVTYDKDPNGSYSKTAAYNALLAYEKLIAIDKGELERGNLRDDQKVDEKKGKGKDAKSKKIIAVTIDKNTKEEAIPKWETKMIEACDRYALIAAADPRLAADEINVRYKSAFIYYDRKHFTQAANRFGDIILKWPDDAQARKAADLSLNILEIREEWSDLARLSRAFYGNKKLAKPGEKWTQELAKIMEGAQYKYIDLIVYQKEKRSEEAAGMFRDFVKEFPKSDYASQALLYSMEIYTKANKLDQGMAVAEQLLTEYPTSQHRPAAIWSLAKFNEQTADFTKASSYFLQYAREWEEKVGLRPDPAGDPKKKLALKKPEDVIKANGDEAAKASDALFNAALWTEGMGDSERAIALFREYAEKYSTVPNAESPVKIAFHIAEIHDLQKDWSRAEKAYEDFLKLYEKRASAGEIFFARYKRARALEHLKRKDEAMKLLEVCAKEFPKVSEADRGKSDYRDAYAYSQFSLLEPKWKAYVAIKFDKVKTLKTALQAKMKTTPTMEADFRNVIAIGSGDWAIAALTRIGMMYQDFSRNFVESPDPPGLDFDQLDLYRAELENRAFPLEEKAIEAYEMALAKSYEIGVYNEYTLAAQDALNRFKPGEYGEVRQVAYTGSEFFSRASAALEASASFGSALEAKAKDGAVAAPVDAAEGSEEAPKAQEVAPAKKKGVLIMDKAAAK
ncbi:tetratricopeptide repeat protein [Vulgatibacter incomptus]|uniref:TPR domain protein, putative component of TonB system n=1 Tax=Vulgatibacter incomptus TaxID=1391653 RepID=A0A0K1PAM1_9BACT|nr:tetratricopeptide repeat protein [Vulgatibacter incomptus]AKU90565.1 TPR domain protein, putative component of TonB system [Vulgatibacter incomptus]